MHINIKRIAAISALALIVVTAAYNSYDNSRIAVKEQIIYIDGLPMEFDGFRILQLSDLHGKNFSDDQSMLIDKVNSLEYDIIVFTGDMEGSNADMSSFIELLKGINRSEYMFYINGNDELAYSEIAGNASDIGKELSYYGCMLLTEPYQINRSGRSLWISNYFKMSSIKKYAGARDVFLRSREEYNAYSNYMAKLENIFSELKDNGDIKIAVTHVPLTLSDYSKLDKSDILDYSLILAGHYHGGQIRIPFYGALFIPDGQNIRNGFFPDQKYVMGLMDIGGIQQYVSAGLGASTIPFRLFNTPEINLLTLKAKQ